MSGADNLDSQLASRLVKDFSERVVALAQLPPARASDVHDSCEVSLSDDRAILLLTCTITGSTYESRWDGSEATALSLASEAAKDTAYLIARTPHYAWLRSDR
jgi:hypothetical protein